MAKSSTQHVITVRDPKTGQLVTVRGAGALKDSKLAINKGIDLTKPIASQISRDKRK